ncbi:DUF2306 domain-containing protein [Geodermatophilus sp. DSM 44513]|uniref:DUF2306 domain-containing protein n=1 Tax=Geodermatophilus sp. DSM 44513 TaxID=1528104 RepID=UPI00127B745D|nr:DUF2306 domain-containing protein [Geodermatophilus sp. DSM 44513]WNV74273.1 DUF2306 domain-containing protein [Geodermatophilus sp. DSM 44513]
MTGWTVLLVGHATSALVCLGLGGQVLLRRRKGDAAHRAAGWCWVAGMAFVATSSFAIRDLRDGRLSFLHVLSVVTLAGVLLGLRAARRHDVRAHRVHMRGSYFGLVAAFVGAVAVPDRLIPTFVVTQPLRALGAAAAIALTTAVLVALAHAAGRRRPDVVSGAPRRVKPGARPPQGVRSGTG